MNNDKRNLHILVVDDEPLIHDIMREILESCQYKVSLASNGLEALHAMVRQEVDLVFMDIRMPVMDGLTAIKFLRKCEQGEHLSLTEHRELAQSLHSRIKGTKTTVVAVTGNIDDREILIEAGMDEYIAKPFKIEKIHNMLNEFCEKSLKGSPAEKRRHPRHRIKNNTITVCNGIAGQAIDISMSGLAIRYGNLESIPNEWSVTLHNTVKKMSTPYLPLKLIRNIAIEVAPSSGVETKTVGAMFIDLDASQKNHIKQFINNLP